MFELNRAIDQWCRQLKVKGFASNEEVLELRDHLESDIARLQVDGHTEEDAFRIASEKVGSVEALSQEFFKSGLMSRLTRYPLALKIVVIVMFMAGLLGLARIITVVLIASGMIPIPSPEAFNPSPAGEIFIASIVRLCIALLFLICAIQILRLKKFWLYVSRCIFGFFICFLAYPVISAGYQVLSRQFTPASEQNPDIVMTTTIYIAEIIELGSLSFSLIISALCLKALFSARINNLFALAQDHEKTEIV